MVAEHHQRGVSAQLPSHVLNGLVHLREKVQEPFMMGVRLVTVGVPKVVLDPVGAGDHKEQQLMGAMLHEVIQGPEPLTQGFLKLVEEKGHRLVEKRRVHIHAIPIPTKPAT